LKEDHKIVKLWEQLPGLTHSKKLLGGFSQDISSLKPTELLAFKTLKLEEKV